VSLAKFWGSDWTAKQGEILVADDFEVAWEKLLVDCGVGARCENDLALVFVVGRACAELQSKSSCPCAQEVDSFGNFLSVAC
jgi:hypothetical protein